MSKFMKFWTLIICLLFIFLIIFTDRVNAQVINVYVGPTSVNTSNGLISRDFASNIGLRNLGEGQIIYNFYVKGQMSIHTIVASTNSHGGSPCQFGVSNSYANNSEQVQLFSIICNVNLSNNDYISNITIWGNNNGQYNINWGGNIQFVNWDATSSQQIAHDYTTILNNIKSDLDTISSNSYLINYDTAQINNNLSTLITNINSGNTNITNEIKQQTQQQHNDAQQQYNFISNTNIDTTTTNNVNNIDTSNSDTKLAVTNFALIPLNFMQSIINSFSSSCSQVCIGQCGGSSGGGHDNAWKFIFPCLDIESIVGSNIYNIIDSLFAFGMVFAFIRSVRNFFINALLLTTDASSEVGVFL